MSNRSKLQFIVGTSDTGEDVLFDFKSSGHALSVGETGSGQSSFMTGAFVTEIIQNYTPDQVKFVMINTKFLQLSQYANIPHLLQPIVTDINKAREVIKSLLDEKRSRFNMFIESGVRDLDEYNAKEATQLPRIILLIPEIAVFGATADKDFFHYSLVDLCQQTYRHGIHLHLGASQPSKETVPGVIIANIDGRIVFKVSSEEYSSRLLPDRARADKLTVPGEFYYSDWTRGPIKLKAPYVSNADIETIVQKVNSRS